MYDFSLTGSQKTYLRGLGQRLEPAIKVGRAGATPTFLKELQRVLCTYDSDYLQLATEGVAHAGIVFGQQDLHYVGEWVNWLSLMHAVYTHEEMANRIEFL